MSKIKLTKFKMKVYVKLPKLIYKKFSVKMIKQI